MRVSRGTLMLCGAAGVLAFGSAAFTSCYRGPAYLPPTTTTTIPSPPNAPASAQTRLGSPCTASDPVNGLVAGSQVHVSWSAPVGGNAPTGYVVTVTTTLPGESRTTTTLPEFGPNETSTDWLCFPIGTRFGASVAAINAAGSSTPTGAQPPLVIAPTGLAWITPATMSDGGVATIAAIDPCPSTRPDGTPVRSNAVQVTLSSTSGDRNFVITTPAPNWSLNGPWSNLGASDPAATLVAYCVDIGDFPNNVLTAQYDIRTVAVNP